MKLIYILSILILFSGCSTHLKWPEVNRWSIQKSEFKNYSGFDTLIVLDSNTTGILKLKENHNTVLGILKLDGVGLTQKIDILISRGFDGVYFIPGTIDADEIITLSHYARMIHPEFIVIVENIHELKNKKIYELVNAFAIVDVLLSSSGEKLIVNLLKKKKPILSLEYLEDKSALVEYARLAKEKGLIPLVGHRPLKGKLIYSDQLFHLARPCD